MIGNYHTEGTINDHAITGSYCKVSDMVEPETSCSLISSFRLLYGLGSLGSQPQQEGPDTPLPSDFHQFLQRNLEVSPGRPRHIFSQHVVVCPRVSSRMPGRHHWPEPTLKMWRSRYPQTNSTYKTLVSFCE